MCQRQRGKREDKKKDAQYCQLRTREIFELLTPFGGLLVLRNF